jgi:hypothetical protein
MPEPVAVVYYIFDSVFDGVFVTRCQDVQLEPVPCTWTSTLNTSHLFYFSPRRPKSVTRQQKLDQAPRNFLHVSPTTGIERFCKLQPRFVGYSSPTTAWRLLGPNPRRLYWNTFGWMLIVVLQPIRLQNTPSCTGRMVCVFATALG